MAHFPFLRSPILDMNTNEIISYDLSMIPNRNQIKRMLNRAFKNSGIYRV